MTRATPQGPHRHRWPLVAALAWTVSPPARIHDPRRSDLRDRTPQRRRFLSLGWTMRTWIAEGRHVEIVTVHSFEAVRARRGGAVRPGDRRGLRGLGVESVSVLCATCSSRRLAPSARSVAS